MTFELTDTPPEAVYGIGGNREYTRYGEQTSTLRENPGKWLRLAIVEITPKTGDDGTVQSAEDAEKDARKRAGNRVGMIRQAKGNWANAEWGTRIAQPGGPGTSFEIWVSFLRDKPAPVAEQNGTSGEDAPEASDSADATPPEAAPEAVSVVPDASTPETQPEAEPAPRRRRG